MSISGPIRHTKEEFLISKGLWAEPFKENSLKENPLTTKHRIHVKENPLKRKPFKDSPLKMKHGTNIEV